MLISRKPLPSIAFISALIIAGVLCLLPNRSALGAPLRGVPADTIEGLPAGVRVETVLTGMDKPIAMAFDPAGRLFYTEKESGKVRMFANGTLQPNPVITFDVSTCSERGLLGIALDPTFNQNHYIYVYYTQGPGCGATQNKVARFVETNGSGSNPNVIFSSPQTAGNHNGGNIHFGPDGKLYISIGDNANADNAQDTSARNGKMHRINPDGSIPNDNPKFGGPNSLPSLYAIGLRNSFDFAFDSVVKGRIFASENGPNCDDEMNRIQAGFNYGWHANYPCDDATPPQDINTIPPLWYLPTGQCCEAPTGITVYTGNQIPQWKDGLFMSSYQEGAKLRHFYLNGDRTALTASKVLEGVKAGMDIETGPDGALYFIEGGGYSPGTLKRFVGAGQVGAPSATVTVPAAPSGTTLPSVSATTVSGTGSQTFPETGKSVTGIFLDYWKGHGGLPQQGYPISGMMMEVSDLNGKSYTVQYFERAVFEMHPENQSPFNVLLSQLGTYQYKRKYPNGAPDQQANTSPNTVTFPETGKKVGGVFLDYWHSHGGLIQQGYPISEEFTVVSDLNGKPYKVQYFERAVFEMHPENQPPYDVLLSQLGTFQYKLKYGRGGAAGLPLPTSTPDLVTSLRQRPLNLPALSLGGACPATQGKVQALPTPAYPSSVYVLGSGPVYLQAINSDAAGLVNPDGTARALSQNGIYGIKGPWISKPDYPGPILIRGRQLDGPNKIGFEYGQSRQPQEEMRLDDANNNGTTYGWSFWPSGISFPSLGCYGLQIDGLNFTDTIILNVVGQP